MADWGGMYVWVLAGVGLGILAACGFRLLAGAFARDAAPAPRKQVPPIPAGLNKNKYLYECATRRGVTTMWLKDLGYTVQPQGDDWTLVPPDIPNELQTLAREALAEIVVAASIVQTPDGPRLNLPADADLWVARAATKWRGTGGGH